MCRNKKGQLCAGLFSTTFGSTTWTRTRDPVINSHLLYQLSYRGMSAILLIKKGKSSGGMKKIIHIIALALRGLSHARSLAGTALA